MNAPTTYADALRLLYGALPMFQRVGPPALKKGLGNIQRLLEDLGNPHHRFPSIHIAGTNGKGSTAHIIAAALQGHGFRVGLYTSPHYYDFRERIKINGQWIEPSEVVAFLQEVWPVVEQIRPSFFELTVAMAFNHFRKNKVDVAVVETGLGGRLDSTNVLRPLVSVITNIGLDHQQFLGDTRAEIAAEKAGIIKEGVPVVIGERDPETAPVFERRTAECSAPLTYADSVVRCRHLAIDASDRGRYRIQWGTAAPVEVWSDLAPPYQARNIATALAALDRLSSRLRIRRSVAVEALRAVRRSTGLMGRWDVLEHRPHLIIEPAHNPHGMEAVAETLRCYGFPRVHVVAAVSSDKDARSLFRPLASLPVLYYPTRFHQPRTMPPDVLAEHLSHLPQPVAETFRDPLAALAAARAAAQPGEAVLVTGSIFLAGEVLEAWQSKEVPIS